MSKEIEEGKFYKFIENTTVMTKRNTSDGGYSSSPTNVEVGVVFEGTNPYSKTIVYDGMPVKEEYHIVYLEGISMFKSYNSYLVETNVASIDTDLIVPISEKEYLEASVKFKNREPYRAKKGHFVNFLAR